MLDNSYSKLTIQASATIRNGLEALNLNCRGIILILDGNKLIGVATDGDIRRAILSGISLDSSIQAAMNTNYVSLSISSQDQLIRETFSKSLKVIPLLDDFGCLIDIADAQRSHRIPLIEPDLTGRELEYVTEAISTGWISSQGSYVREFELSFESMHKGMHALAVSNGTVALHLGLLALGIKSDDEVIVPNLTFAASANAVIYCGAKPVLCEVDPKTLCIDIAEAEKLVSSKTKAIMPVHLYGQSCNMDSIKQLADKFQLSIIEDSAEALGTTWKQSPVGTFGDVATFSFFGNKTVSTGEGGMILFRDHDLYLKAKILRDHGMDPNKRYWHDYVGFNYRITNIQSAIGVAQMERLPNILRRKRRILNTYNSAFESLHLVTLLPRDYSGSYHSCWLYTLILDESVSRDLLANRLLDMGIDNRPVFFPLHEMPPYQHYKRSASVINSLHASRYGISLPTSATMTDIEVNYVTSRVKEALIDIVP